MWYLASAYTKYPEGHEAAYKLALKQATLLIAAGWSIFSPIVHSHPIAKLLNTNDAVDYTTYHLWEEINKTMIMASHGIIIVKDSFGAWKESTGVIREAAFANKYAKNIYMNEEDATIIMPLDNCESQYFYQLATYPLEE